MKRRSAWSKVTQQGRSLYQRVRREPALVTTAVIAVANLLGHDVSGSVEELDAVVSTLILVGGIAIRRRVTPVTPPTSRSRRKRSA